MVDCLLACLPAVVVFVLQRLCCPSCHLRLALDPLRTFFAPSTLPAHHSFRISLAARMALQQHIVPTELTLALTGADKDVQYSESGLEQLGHRIPAIETKYLDPVNCYRSGERGSVSKFDPNNDFLGGAAMKFTDANMKPTTCLEPESEAKTKKHNSNVHVIDESGLRAVVAPNSGLPWRTENRDELAKPLSGGELPMKETIQFYFNNDSHGELVKISISESEVEADMAHDVNNSKVASLEESEALRLSRSIPARDSWLRWKTATDGAAKLSSSVVPQKKRDARTIAVTDKSTFKDVDYNESHDQKRVRDSCQLYRQDQRGLKHFSLHKSAVLLADLSSAEEELQHESWGVLGHTSHVPQTFLSNQKVLHQHIISKNQSSFDEIEAENLSAVQKSQCKDSKMSLGSFSGFTPVIRRPSGTISSSSPHVVSGAQDVVHPRHIPFNSPGNICAQLTLFYAGTVSVYDNIPANQAHAIMNFAGSGNSCSGNARRSPSMQVSNQSNAISSSFNKLTQPSSHPPLPCTITPLKTQHNLPTMPPRMQNNPPLSSRDAVKPAENKQQELVNLLSTCQSVVPIALPVARKASLARFLERRRGRIKSVVPNLEKASDLEVPLHNGRKSANANPGTLFYDESSSIHAEGQNGRKHKLLDDGTIRLQYAGVCEMDVEDQNWQSSAENTEQIVEDGSATQLSSSCT